LVMVLLSISVVIFIILIVVKIWHLGKHKFYSA
jgi:hypothetical protein